MAWAHGGVTEVSKVSMRREATAIVTVFTRLDWGSSWAGARGRGNGVGQRGGCIYELGQA